MNRKNKQDHETANNHEKRADSGGHSTMKKKPYVPPVIHHQAHIRNITFSISKENDLINPITGESSDRSRGGSGEVWDNIFDD